MDISDGLVTDLGKLCAASGVGARVDGARLPISPELRAASELLGVDAVDMALDGGEDYELLLLASPADAPGIIAAVAASGTPCAAVGEIVKSGLHIIVPDGSSERPAARRGWDHFPQ